MPEPIVIAKSFAGFVRWCGLVFCLFINSLFTYIWIDDPKFVQGPIDGPEIFMALVTIGMIGTGLAGLFMFFRETALYADRIVVKGLLRTTTIHVSDITYVHPTRFYSGTYLFSLDTADGKTREITTASPALIAAFDRVITDR